MKSTLLTVLIAKTKDGGKFGWNQEDFLEIRDVSVIIAADGKQEQYHPNPHYVSHL